MSNAARLLLLAALALFGCGSPSTRHDLRQGAPTPMEVPAFEPASEAPITTGHPGTLSPGANMPRSTDGRMLPQTEKTRREAGLWSAQPTASAHAGEPMIAAVPLPTEVDDVRADEADVRTCASEMSASIYRVGKRAYMDRLTPKVRQCIAAQMYRYCGRFILDHIEAARRAGRGYDAAESERYRRLRDVGAAFAAKACDGVAPSTDDFGVFQVVITDWAKRMAQ